MMRQHADESRTISVVRVGQSRHAFILCNFKHERNDGYHLKVSCSIDDLVLLDGRGPMLEMLIEPFNVKNVLCNDPEFHSILEQKVGLHSKVQFLCVDAVPNYRGREVEYELV